MLRHWIAMSDALDGHTRAECSSLWRVAARTCARKKKWRWQKDKWMVIVIKRVPLYTPASTETWDAMWHEKWKRQAHYTQFF
jgi:hypothetical protein